MATVVNKDTIAATKAGKKSVAPKNGEQSKEVRELMALMRDGAVKNLRWKSTTELLHDVFLSLKLFQLGIIDAEAARVYMGQLRNAAKLLTINLEYARVTGQIQKGQKVLQGFGIE